jgi:hypothetical protein
MKLGGRWQMFKHLIFSLGLTNKCQSLFNHENSLENDWFTAADLHKNIQKKLSQFVREKVNTLGQDRSRNGIQLNALYFGFSEIFKTIRSAPVGKRRRYERRRKNVDRRR